MCRGYAKTVFEKYLCCTLFMTESSLLFVFPRRDAFNLEETSQLEYIGGLLSLVKQDRQLHIPSNAINLLYRMIK